MNNTVKPSILIVEDEQTLLKALVLKFSEAGFQVFEAIDGAQGLALAQEKKTSLILLDIVLPVMDGLTMLAKLREDQSVKDTPVLLLTNLSDQESLSRALELGAIGYLVKADLSLDSVVSKVKEILHV